MLARHQLRGRQFHIMHASWTSLALAALAPLLAPTNARAQRSNVDVALHYDVEASVRSCPNAAELRAAIAEQLGYDPFTPSAGYDVRVKIAGHEQEVEAQIEWLDERGVARGERRLASQSGDCVELASGVVFAVAVQLQLWESESAEQPTSTPSPKPVPAPKAHARPPAAPVSTRRVLLGVGGVARVGSQPGVAPGLRGFASLQRRAWALSLDAHATLPTSIHTSGSASFSARELGFGSAACIRYGVLDACALGVLMFASIRGRGVDQARSPGAVGVGVGVRFQLSWPWSDRVAALAHVDVLAQPTVRDVLLNRERVWTSPPLAVAIGFDMAAIFR